MALLPAITKVLVSRNLSLTEDPHAILDKLVDLES